YALDVMRPDPVQCQWKDLECLFASYVRQAPVCRAPVTCQIVSLDQSPALDKGPGRGSVIIPSDVGMASTLDIQPDFPPRSPLHRRRDIFRAGSIDDVAG